jgi:hypothetical protein
MRQLATSYCQVEQARYIPTQKTCIASTPIDQNLAIGGLSTAGRVSLGPTSSREGVPGLNGFSGLEAGFARDSGRDS